MRASMASADVLAGSSFNRTSMRAAETVFNWSSNSRSRLCRDGKKMIVSMAITLRKTQDTIRRERTAVKKVDRLCIILCMMRLSTVGRTALGEPRGPCLAMPIRFDQSSGRQGKFAGPKASTEPSPATFSPSRSLKGGVIADALLGTIDIDNHPGRLQFKQSPDALFGSRL